MGRARQLIPHGDGNIAEPVLPDRVALRGKCLRCKTLGPNEKGVPANLISQKEKILEGAML